jgi:SAM-dependent methyltransferase
MTIDDEAPDGAGAGAAAARFYDALAPIYDAWQSCDGMTPFAHVTLGKLAPLLARAGVRSFLDLGCGTGELLLGLRRLHADWRLAGIDGSAGMLAVARRKPGADGVAWAQAHLADAPDAARADTPAAAAVAGPFDAVGAFYDTFNHLPDEDALARALASAAARLRPGGQLIFDLTNELGFARWWNNRLEWWGVGWRLLVETSFDPDTGTARAAVTLSQGESEQALTLLERAFSEPQVRRALAAAGLTVDKTEPWSPFSADAPGKTWWSATKMT